MLLEQHTAAEAAALCGRPQKTVEAQVYRAKKMLAETIRQERRSEDGMVSG
jgi:DNA-directed RNA polymerase specialized sigma24 family protein